MAFNHKQVISQHEPFMRFHIMVMFYKAVTSFHDLGFDKYHEVFGNNLEIRILGLWLIRSTKALLISRRVLLILSFRHFIFIILFCCHTVISCRTQFVSLGPCPTRQSSSVCTHCSTIITRNTDGKRTVVSGHTDMDVHHLYPVKSSSWMRSESDVFLPCVKNNINGTPEIISQN